MNSLILQSRKIFDKLQVISELEDLDDFREDICNQLRLINNDVVIFPLVVTIDDLILNASLDKRDSWIKNTLQREFFSTQNGGEAFYDRLKVLLLKNDKALLELYLLCFYFGFHGQYRFSHREKRQQLIYEVKNLVETEAEQPKPVFNQRHLFYGLIGLQILFFACDYVKLSLGYHQLINTINQL